MNSNHRKKINLLLTVMVSVIMLYSIGAVFAATPTPTQTTVTITVRVLCTDDVRAGSAVINISPASLEGINQVSGGYMSSGTITLSYPVNTQVTLTAAPISPTGFGGWSQSSIFLSGNPASFVVNGGETIVGFFSAPDPTVTPRIITPTPRSSTPTPTRRRATITPTPTQSGAITVYVGIQNTGEEPANSCIIDLSPASLEGTARIVGGFASGTTKTYPVTYMPNTQVTFTASTVDRTQFQYWSLGTTRLNGNPVTVIVQGEERITATFWAAFPTTIRRVTVTPTPTPTPRVPATVTPTPTPSGSYVVSYAIQSDWGNGATVSVTIKNNSAAAVNGWTLAWTFPGNQTISNLWNGTYTQSGAAVSVKDAGHNANIPANGGSVNFGFNMNYSGTNAKPTSFTLNGTPCLVQ